MSQEAPIVRMIPDDLEGDRIEAMWELIKVVSILEEIEKNDELGDAMVAAAMLQCVGVVGKFLDRVGEFSHRNGGGAK